MNSYAANEPGIFEKIFNVFVAPQKTFESVDRKPDWLVPMAIVVIIAIFYSIMIMPIAMNEGMDKQRVKMEERGMSPDEIDRAMEMGKKFGNVFGIVGGSVGPILYLLLIAGLFLFIGNTILAGQTTYTRMLSVVSYTSLIGSVGSLILLPLILSKKTMEVSFSLASFLSVESSESFLYQLLKKIDFFTIWQIIVAGIGFAIIYKFTTKKGIAAIAGLYIVIIGIVLILQSIF